MMRGTSCKLHTAHHETQSYCVIQSRFCAVAYIPHGMYGMCHLDLNRKDASEWSLSILPDSTCCSYKAKRVPQADLLIIAKRCSCSHSKGQLIMAPSCHLTRISSSKAWVDCRRSDPAMTGQSPALLWHTCMICYTVSRARSMWSQY